MNQLQRINIPQPKRGTQTYVFLLSLLAHGPDCLLTQSEDDEDEWNAWRYDGEFFDACSSRVLESALPFISGRRRYESRRLITIENANVQITFTVLSEKDERINRP